MRHRARTVGHLRGDVAERRVVDALDVAEAGVDVRRVQQDVSDRRERVGDRLVGELHLVVDPLVVDLGARLTQHEVFDPVGAGPARRTARFEPGAPRGGPRLLLDGLGEGEQLVPRLRNLDAPLLELRRRVPDVALDVGEHGCGIERVVEGAVLLPVGRPVGIHVLLDLFGRRLHITGVDEALQQTRLRNDRDVGCVATGHLRDDVGLEALVAGVGDLDAAVLAPVVEDLLQRVGLGARDAAGDPDGAARVAAAVTPARTAAFRAARQGEPRHAHDGQRRDPAPP